MVWEDGKCGELCGRNDVGNMGMDGKGWGKWVNVGKRWAKMGKGGKRLYRWEKSESTGKQRARRHIWENMDKETFEDDAFRDAHL